MAQSQASETLLASEIFVAFDTNEQAAMAIFSDRVIQLEGELLSKDLSNEKEPQILLKGNGEEGFVRHLVRYLFLRVCWCIDCDVARYQTRRHDQADQKAR